MLIVGKDKKFIYDNTQNYIWNFEKWLRWTNREHRNYNEKDYTREEGRPVFDKLFIKGR